MRFSSSPSPPSRRAAPPSPPGPHLRLVSDDVYPDWESVYRDNVARLYRLMIARVGNRPDAEDLTAETFRAALRPLRLSSSKGEVRAYLLTTARSVLASYWRRRLGDPAVTVIDPEADMAFLIQPSDSGGPDPSTALARQILQALPDRYRRVLELRFFEGASIKDTASTMAVTVANAKVLQHRALQLASKIAADLER